MVEEPKRTGAWQAAPEAGHLAETGSTFDEYSVETIGMYVEGVHPDLVSEVVTYRQSEAKAAEELVVTFAARLETEESRIDRVLARLGLD